MRGMHGLTWIVALGLVAGCRGRSEPKPAPVAKTAMVDAAPPTQPVTIDAAPLPPPTISLAWGACRDVDTLNADLAARNVADRIQNIGGGEQFPIVFGPPAALEKLAADGLLPAPQRITDEFYEKVLGITKDALRATEATPKNGLVM